jgi:hypothetical protein
MIDLLMGGLGTPAITNYYSGRLRIEPPAGLAFGGRPATAAGCLRYNKKMADDDFLDLIGATLTGLFDDAASAAPAAPEPQPASTPPPPVPAATADADTAARPVRAGEILYVGLDQATYNAFEVNFGGRRTVYATTDLPEVRAKLQSGAVAAVVFDPSSFVRPGVAITRWIKENGLPVVVMHVISEAKITEDYEKFRLYHMHLQPDLRGDTNELHGLIRRLSESLGD